jgi:hypothetical protein
MAQYDITVLLPHVLHFWHAMSPWTQQSISKNDSVYYFGLGDDSQSEGHPLSLLYTKLSYPSLDVRQQPL